MCGRLGIRNKPSFFSTDGRGSTSLVLLGHSHTEGVLNNLGKGRCGVPLDSGGPPVARLLLWWLFIPIPGKEETHELSCCHIYLQVMMHTGILRERGGSGLACPHPPGPHRSFSKLLPLVSTQGLWIYRRQNVLMSQNGSDGALENHQMKVSSW